MEKPTHVQIVTAFKSLPQAAQEFLVDPEKLSEFMLGIKTKYQLGPATLGSVSESIGYLLMGLVPPAQLPELFKSSGLSPAVTTAIVSDIQSDLLVRIKAAMAAWKPSDTDLESTAGAQTKEKNQSPQPVRPVAMPIQTPQRVVMPIPNYAPPKPVAPVAQKPVAPIQPPVQAAPATPPPAPKQWANQYPAPSTVIQANPALPLRPAQVADSMMHYKPFPKPSAPRAVPLRPADPFGAQKSSHVAAPVQKPVVNSDHILEDHEEPSPKLRPTSDAIPAGGRAYIPRTAPPPPNLPGVMPPPVPNVPRPAAPAPRPFQQFTMPKSTAPVLPKPVPPTPSPAPRPPDIEHYSMDPYREPLEETTPE